MTPIQASLKKNEGFVYRNFLDKRKKVKPKFQVNYLIRVAVLRKNFSKGDTTNWSYEMYKIRKIISDTVPVYKIDQLSERYNESSLRKTELPRKENDSVIKKIKYHLRIISK